MNLNVSRIQNLIAQRKWTVADFAEKVGVHRNTIYTMLKTGKSKPETIKRMAETLNVEELSLFEGYRSESALVQQTLADLDTPINRVRRYMNAHNMTAFKFARLTDLPARTVSRRFHDGNLDIDFLRGLLKVFPEIDIRWVITGEVSPERTSIAAEPPGQYGNADIKSMRAKLQIAYDRAFELERILKENGIKIR